LRNKIISIISVPELTQRVVEIPFRKVGLIMGKEGKNVLYLQKETGAVVDLIDGHAVLKGEKYQVDQAERLINSRSYPIRDGLHYHLPVTEIRPDRIFLRLHNGADAVLTKESMAVGLMENIKKDQVVPIKIVNDGYPCFVELVTNIQQDVRVKELFGYDAENLCEMYIRNKPYKGASLRSKNTVGNIRKRIENTDLIQIASFLGDKIVAHIALSDHDERGVRLVSWKMDKRYNIEETSDVLFQRLDEVAIKSRQRFIFNIIEIDETEKKQLLTKHGYQKRSFYKSTELYVKDFQEEEKVATGFAAVVSKIAKGFGLSKER